MYIEIVFVLFHRMKIWFGSNVCEPFENTNRDTLKRSSANYFFASNSCHFKVSAANSGARIVHINLNTTVFAVCRGQPTVFRVHRIMDHASIFNVKFGNIKTRGISKYRFSIFCLMGTFITTVARHELVISFPTYFSHRLTHSYFFLYCSLCKIRAKINK